MFKSNQVNPRGCSGGSEFLSQTSGTVVGTAEEMLLGRPFFRRPGNQSRQAQWEVRKPGWHWPGHQNTWQDPNSAIH